MGSGQTSDSDLSAALEGIRCAGGDFAEVGVWTGQVFRRLCHWVKGTSRKVHGFDSWIGLASPTEYDDREKYPRGHFGIGGAEKFKQILEQYAIDASTYKLHPGYVPQCLEDFDGVLAFAYVDLDHYEPTVAALPWVWQRLLPGGVLMVDDYCPVAALGAFLAIAKWLPAHAGRLELLRHSNDQLVFRKLW